MMSETYRDTLTNMWHIPWYDTTELLHVGLDRERRGHLQTAGLGPFPGVKAAGLSH